jgi:hypothetical protein
MASAARDAVQTPVRRRKPRPSDAHRRILHINPILWRAVKIAAIRDRRTLSGWVSVLCERELGWLDDDDA